MGGIRQCCGSSHGKVLRPAHDASFSEKSRLHDGMALAPVALNRVDWLADISQEMTQLPLTGNAGVCIVVQ